MPILYIQYNSHVFSFSPQVVEKCNKLGGGPHHYIAADMADNHTRKALIEVSVKCDFYFLHLFLSYRFTNTVATQ